MARVDADHHGMNLTWTHEARSQASALLRIIANRYESWDDPRTLLRAAEDDLDDVILAWAHGLASPGELDRHWLARDMAAFHFEGMAASIAVQDGLSPDALLKRVEELRVWAGQTGDWALARDQLAALLDAL